MKRFVARTLIVASALICASIPLVAHHGTNASYDPTKKVMLDAKICTTHVFFLFWVVSALSALFTV